MKQDLMEAKAEKQITHVLFSPAKNETKFLTVKEIFLLPAYRKLLNNIR